MLRWSTTELKHRPSLPTMIVKAFDSLPSDTQHDSSSTSTFHHTRSDTSTEILTHGQGAHEPHHNCKDLITTRQGWKGMASNHTCRSALGLSVLVYSSLWLLSSKPSWRSGVVTYRVLSHTESSVSTVQAPPADAHELSTAALTAAKVEPPQGVAPSQSGGGKVEEAVDGDGEARGLIGATCAEEKPDGDEWRGTWTVLERYAPLANANADPQRRPIPFVGTNVDYDNHGYLWRLLAKLDYPVDTLGCAPGWNALVDRMMAQDPHGEQYPWALILNNDVYFPPGVLKQVVDRVWSTYDRDPQRFCMAFVGAPSSHDRWSAYVITRRFLDLAGRFDENFYPAYYEDVEMAYRHGRLIHSGHCDGPEEYNIPFVHGEEANPHDAEYISGSKKVMEKMMSDGADPKEKQRALQWKAKTDRGVKASKRYFNYKWGCGPPSSNDFDIYACSFEAPFNHSVSLPLAYWRLDATRRRCIETGEGIGPDGVCWYDTNVVAAPKE